MIILTRLTKMETNKKSKTEKQTSYLAVAPDCKSLSMFPGSR